MMHSITTVLTAVQRRLWCRHLMRGVLRGLSYGAAFAIGLVCLSFLFGAPHFSGGFAALAVLVGIIGGLVVALSQRPSLHSAAETVDRYYAMKDRTVSALAFTIEVADDPLRRLQIADTAAHLRKVRAQDCVPLTIPPTTGSWSIGLLSVTIAIVAYAQWLIPTAEATRPIPLAVQQAELLRSTVVAEIEKLAEETGSEELQSLSEELQRLTNALEQQVTDQEAYFATLSAMEQAITRTRANMQFSQNEKQLRDIAAAIKPADAMRAAAEAVEAEDYRRAASELEAIDPSELGDQERRAVSENLKKLQPQDRDPQANKLAQATKQLEQALETKDADQARQATEQISDAAKQQAVAETIEESMDRQMNRVSDAKGQGRDQGQTPSQTAQKTESPSQTWGKAASGNTQDGDSAPLQSTRERQRLTGQKGDGFSETETVAASATEHAAEREYAERYQAYRRQAEAVLESEPLPIGHRETIRRYFENIRPQTPQ
ncbi:MAG: hypothetical protein WD119_02845 [Pirellulaceae bacterium]